MYSYHEYLKPRELFLTWDRCELIGAYYHHCYNTGWDWKKQVQESRSLHYMLMKGRKYKGALWCEQTCFSSQPRHCGPMGKWPQHDAEIITSLMGCWGLEKTGCGHQLQRLCLHWEAGIVGS